MSETIRCPKCKHDLFETSASGGLKGEAICARCGSRFEKEDLFVGRAREVAEKEIEKMLRRSGLKFTKTRR